MKERKNKIISISLIIALILLLCILLLIERKNYQNNLKQSNRGSIVKDASVFYTVDRCANKYINLIADGNSKDLMTVMNKDYIKDYNLNTNNIISKIDVRNFQDASVSFKTKKMYQEIVSENLTKYYLYGEVYRDGIDDIQKICDYYLIVSINADTLVFDITPYDGKIFKENK